MSSMVVIFTFSASVNVFSTYISSVLVTFNVTAGKNGASSVARLMARSSSVSMIADVPESSPDAEPMMAPSFLTSRVNPLSSLLLTVTSALNTTGLPARISVSPAAPLNVAETTTGASGSFGTSTGSLLSHAAAKRTIAIRINDLK